MNEKEIISIRKGIIKLKKKKLNISELQFLLEKKTQQINEDIQALEGMETKEWSTLKEFKQTKPVEERNWHKEFNRRGLNGLIEQ